MVRVLLRLFWKPQMAELVNAHFARLIFQTESNPNAIDEISVVYKRTSSSSGSTQSKAERLDEQHTLYFLIRLYL